MKTNILKTSLKFSLIASIAICNLNAKDGIEVNALATTRETYALGLSYAINENIKVGAGVLSINGLESSLTTTKDKFLGGYGTVELKYPIANKLDLFIDGAYVGGEIDKANKNVNGAIGDGGLKYHLSKYDLYAGYTTEKSAFAGVEFGITPKWRLNLGGSYNTDYNEGQALVSISYNFESGFSSAISTSAKHLVEDEYRSYVRGVVASGDSDLTCSQTRNTWYWCFHCGSCEG